MGSVEEIKSRIDIVDLISTYVPLKKAGRSYKGLCPFHTEKTPSFVVFPESQSYRCFGCGKTGDIFTFYMDREGRDFREALSALADQAGVTLQPLTPAQVEHIDRRDHLLGLLKTAAEYYHQLLIEAPQAEDARRYISRRGLRPETWQHFQIGCAPPGWDSLLKYLTDLGYPQADLLEAGLLSQNDAGRVYDRFRNRLMIPIHDPQGAVVGFGARALAAEDNPKYLNSPQGPLFDKSSLLYGFYQGRRALREGGSGVIVEGYMDVIQAHQAGYTDVVAQMGTALTETQIKLLGRHVKRLTLALDPDAAGQMATRRGLDALRQVMDEAARQVTSWELDGAGEALGVSVTPEIDARGLLHYKANFNLEIRVMRLPAGQDPDDLIRENPAAWPALLQQAEPLVSYLIKAAVEGQNLDDPEAKNRVAEQVLPIINRLGSSVERQHYRQMLARLLRLPEDTFQGVAQAQRAAPPPRRNAPHSQGQPAWPMQHQGPPQVRYVTSRTLPLEEFCLAGMLRYPHLLSKINRKLAEALEVGAALPAQPLLHPRLVTDDFTSVQHRLIFLAWQQALEQSEWEPGEALLASVDTDSARQVEAWTAHPLLSVTQSVRATFGQPTGDARIQEEVIKAALMLREQRLKMVHEELCLVQAEDQAQMDAITVELGQLARTRSRLEQARRLGRLRRPSA